MSRKVTVLFGDMTFYDKKIDGVHKCSVHNIGEILVVDLEEDNTTIEDNLGVKYDSYLIPTIYTGQIIFEG